MNAKAIEEARKLNNALIDAISTEERRRDSMGRTISDKNKLRRLNHIKKLAFDRWRRRAGHAEWCDYPGEYRWRN